MAIGSSSTSRLDLENNDRAGGGALLTLQSWFDWIWKKVKFVWTLLFNWETIFFGLALFSTLITPPQFAFLEMKSITGLAFVDLAHICFLIYVIVKICRACYDTNLHASRYLMYMGSCSMDIIASIPWVYIYYVFGESVFHLEPQIITNYRWILLSRIICLWKVYAFISKMEENHLLAFLSSPSMKMFGFTLIMAHVGGCVLFYSAVGIPTDIKGNTWIGTLQLGKQDFSDFQNMPLWKLYITSMYFGFMTLTTIGFGAIHAVNDTEKILIMILMSASLLYYAYVSYENKNPDSAVSVQQAVVNWKLKNEKHEKRKKDTLTEPLMAVVNTDINAKNSFGKTALHLAASMGELEAAQMIIESPEVDIDARDNQGYTPLFDAMEGGHEKMMTLLKSKGADVNKGDVGSFLCAAVAAKNVHYVKWLLNEGLDPNALDKNNNTPFMVAAEKGYTEMMKLLRKPEVTEEAHSQSTQHFEDEDRIIPISD